MAQPGIAPAVGAVEDYNLIPPVQDDISRLGGGLDVAGREALAQVEANLIDPAPEVYLTNYGSSSIEYTVRCWTKPEDYAATDLALNEALRAAFEHHGVEMTYDHLNVHMVDR